MRNKEIKLIIKTFKKAFFINIIFIIFFEPIFALAANLADGGGSSSSNIPYEIPPEIKSNCEKNIPLYKSAAQEAGLPWQALAAIHFREANCDPNRSSMSGEALGSRNPDDGNVYSTLEESLKATAAHLKENAKWVYNIELTENPDDASLGWAFLAYNRGRMYRDGVSASGSSCGEEWKNTHYDKSPYVVNFIDENHKNMKWNGCIDSNMTHADARAGALTIYKLLGGESSGIDECSNTGESTAKWVQKNGWEDWIEDPKVEVRPYTGAPAAKAFDPNRKITPEIVVLHYTGNVNDTSDAIWNYFNGGAHEEAFCSFIVGKDGKIIQAAPANVQQVCVSGYNNISVNIEGVGNYEAVYPSQEERDSYIWLVDQLIKKYNLKVCDIWAHGELNPNSRSDPGRQFAKETWDRLGGQNIEWQNHPECQNRPPK